ncbi:Ig-like domain-containing protein [Planococcus alpniumensis]|uniref:Ig-like domain-containing protein n=1 Tax=Planococcus alpniumensis TaxID=2708345 RepID=UPI001B8AE020|nr:Ig-like domain-containing protein [Planococcus sp. MSAK28401]
MNYATKGSFDNGTAVAYPYDGQTDVSPVWFDDESPSPLSLFNKRRTYSGFPISLSVHDQETAKLLAEEVHLWDSDKRDVEFYLIDNRNDPSNSRKNIFIIPKEKLKPESTYHVSVKAKKIDTKGKEDSLKKEWSFKTQTVLKIKEMYFNPHQNGSSNLTLPNAISLETSPTNLPDINWMLKDSNGEMVYSVEGSSINQTIQYNKSSNKNMKEFLNTLSPGKYVLEVGTSLFSKKEAYEIVLNADRQFEIGRLFQNSIVSPANVTFDWFKRAKVNFTLSLNGNKLLSIADDETQLVEGKDYLLINDTVELKEEYLNKKPLGEFKLVFKFDAGSSQTVKVTVTDTTPIDTVPPSSPRIDKVTDASTKVTGTAEAGSTINVQAGAKSLGKATTDVVGKFVVEIERQKAGTKLSITATDVAGNTSESTSISVMDATAPVVPTVDPVTNQSESVRGKAEVGSTIQVKAGSTVIGTGPTKADGTFTVSIAKQKAETKLSINATDAAKNVSEAAMITVFDVTAPAIPTVEEVTDQSIKVAGKAEGGTTVNVKAGAKEIGMVKTTADGNFAVIIEKQRAGTKLSITATDKAGNVSDSANITVKDGTAPVAPVVDKMTERSSTISGTAEAGSDVLVKVGTRELIRGKASIEGAFSLAIEPQIAGTVLTVVAIDSSGNRSAETKVLVEKSLPALAGRISGTDRYTTAIAISKEGWKTANTVILATAGDFPDALAGGPLAYQENAPILLTRTKALNVETKEEIERLGAKKVIILGSKGAVSAEAETELKKMGLVTERLGGKTRFETAALIAGKMDSDQAVIANGLNFPDVLSVSSYAAKNGVPILLTRTDRLPDETKAALDGISSTYVIGSTGVVSKAVSDSLPKPTRFGGKDRYETGYEVATKLKLGTDKAYIATGSNFPDALAGSVLAAKNNAPILLVRPQQIPEATNKQLASYDGFSIFGGTGAVSDSVKKHLDESLKN